MLHKIWLVTQREYLTRVRKKSFILMTILTPLIVVLFYGVVFYFTLNKDIGANVKKIYVSDKNGLFTPKLKNSPIMEFTYGYVEPEKQAEFLKSEEYFAILQIPDETITQIKQVQLISTEQPSLSNVMHIERMLENEVKNELLAKNGIDKDYLNTVNNTLLSVKSKKITEHGTESASVGASTVIGYAGAIIIYMFIFLYGVQIMRGVIEEKTNRIVEVIISSIKPFELMMGKIAGIALVGLTQFSLWVLLITILGGSVSGIVMQAIGGGVEQAANVSSKATPTNEITDMMQALGNYNFTYIIGMFVFYFIGGYLFYGALFAAIGSAVDSETDTQQFMLPITMPLVFALILAQSAVAANPNGTLAVWLSIIPITSPVIMMVRLLFDVPTWQVALSVASLIIGFIFTTWLASRIYRIGILMYGQKPSYKLIVKWLFSKQ